MSTQSSLTWNSCGLTTVGTVRKRNEDAYLTLPEHKLWVVADGMGGHNQGDVASQSIIDALSTFSNDGSTLNENIDYLENTICDINTTLFKKSSGDAKQLSGSTIALIYAYRQHVFYLWAGDSRIYRYRNKSLTQISHDHSFVQGLVDRGLISPSEARQHPSANIITRAIGVTETLILDMDCEIVQPGDKYLLCTDGLLHRMTQNDIAMALEMSPYKAAQKLIDTALANAANDNVTVIVIEANAEIQ